jgi:hypothetical protein
MEKGVQMTRIHKALGLTLAVVCALGAVMAAGASAAELTGFNTTTGLHEGGTVKGTDLEEPVFTVSSQALQVRCSENTYTGSSTTGTEPEMQIKPSYNKCNAFLFGGKVGSAEVKMTGCEYRMKIAGGGPDTWTGTTTLVCPAGVSGWDIQTSTGCDFLVPAAKNSAVNGHTYTNNTATKPTDVVFDVNATNVHITVVKGKVFECGVSTGDTLTGATEKASETWKAFNSKGEQIDLTVM